LRALSLSRSASVEARNAAYSVDELGQDELQLELASQMSFGRGPRDRFGIDSARKVWRSILSRRFCFEKICCSFAFVQVFAIP
jgi:hypothetical protein